MAVEDKILKINIKIDGRAYPLTINLKDEERYRKAAKMVNETLSKFRKKFREMESHDILAMTAFQIALSKTELDNREDNSLFIENIKDLNDDISDFLKDKKKEVAFTKIFIKARIGTFSNKLENSFTGFIM